LEDDFIEEEDLEDGLDDCSFNIRALLALKACQDSHYLHDRNIFISFIERQNVSLLSKSSKEQERRDRKRRKE
jgi:hypothetical protein